MHFFRVPQRGNIIIYHFTILICLIDCIAHQSRRAEMIIGLSPASSTHACSPLSVHCGPYTSPPPPVNTPASRVSSRRQYVLLITVTSVTAKCVQRSTDISSILQ